MMLAVDFIINQKPYAISFECPYCDTDIQIDWDKVDVPECWSDFWGYVNCPYCNKVIELRDYEMD